VSDADAVHAEWSRARVEGRLTDPFNTEYGIREFAYPDPDGALHRVGLTSVHDAPSPSAARRVTARRGRVSPDADRSVWIVFAEIPAIRRVRSFRMIVAGFLLAVASLLRINVLHYGQFG
jgi:hypothetical protein